MDIPDLVQQALGDEAIRTGVSLGDDDVVCFTPSRALVYHGEGLISDDGVEEFPLDTERLSIKRGRRKTKFVLRYIEESRSFTIPGSHGEDVLERLVEGVLRVNDVIDPGESVAGVYLFSELTLVIADRRVVKHVGSAVWDEDVEVYSFADVTGLEFERTSVATSIVVGIDGRPQRVKVPNDNAPVVRRTLQEALFAFHDVSSLEELNRVLGDDDGAAVDDASAADDLTLGSGIDPLVTDRDDDPARGVEDPFAAGSASDEPDGEAQPEGSTVDAVGTGDAVGGFDSEESADAVGDTGTSDPSPEGTNDGATPPAGETTAVPGDVATREDVETVADRLEELTDAVDRQNELLKRQHRAMKQLAERLDEE
jgi:hypothetical protein